MCLPRGNQACHVNFPYRKWVSSSFVANSIVIVVLQAVYWTLDISSATVHRWCNAETADAWEVQQFVILKYKLASLTSLACVLVFANLQCLGAISGSALLLAVTAAPARGTLGANDLLNGTGIAQAVAVEFFLTMLLVFVVFAAIDERNKAKNMAPLTIGLAVTCAHLFGVSLLLLSLFRYSGWSNVVALIDRNILFIFGNNLCAARVIVDYSLLEGIYSAEAELATTTAKALSVGKYLCQNLKVCYHPAHALAYPRMSTKCFQRSVMDSQQPLVPVLPLLWNCRSLILACPSIRQGHLVQLLWLTIGVITG